jgi:putative transposase
MTRWQERAEDPALQLLQWLEVPEGTYYNWKQRYGKVNEHNAWIPRDHWLNEWEKQAIIDFHLERPLEGYRRLIYMMLDANVVAAAPSTVYRVLQRAGLIRRSQTKLSLKANGFQQALTPHQHWHIDVSYLNIAGTFYYLISILDGYSRFIVHCTTNLNHRELFDNVFRQRQR